MASTVQNILAGNEQRFTHILSISQSSGLKITSRPRARSAMMIATILSELSIFEQTRVFRSGSVFQGGFDDIVSVVSVFVTTVQLSELARRTVIGILVFIDEATWLLRRRKLPPVRDC